MVRVAVLSDIHGNLPAMEAVLAELEDAAPDQIVVCGDVASGPMPAETIDRLMSLRSVRFVRGNADRELVAAFDSAHQTESEGPGADWCAAQISRAQRDLLASFETTVLVEIEGLGRVLFCHGSPRSDEEMMTSATPEARLLSFVADAEADVVVCGHTHIPFDREVGGIRVMNPSSVGMPYGEPGAFWSVLSTGVEMRRTEYDRAAAAARIRKSGWPDAEEFAAGNVLSVPSVEEAMSFFRSRGGP